MHKCVCSVAIFYDFWIIICGVTLQTKMSYLCKIASISRDRLAAKIKLKELFAVLQFCGIFKKLYLESLPRPKCSSYARGHRIRCTGSAMNQWQRWNSNICEQCCHFLRFFNNDTWSHFLDQNVVSVPTGIKFGSREVRVKACHISVAKMKIKELRAVLPLEIFKK